MKKVEVRKSNIELLRIVSMFLIIIFHLICHGNININGTTTNGIIMEIFKMGGGIRC